MDRNCRKRAAGVPSEVEIPTKRMRICTPSLDVEMLEDSDMEIDFCPDSEWAAHCWYQLIWWLQTATNWGAAAWPSNLRNVCPWIACLATPGSPANFFLFL
ncbi:unnamed protein product [Boreogadus saida]